MWKVLGRLYMSELHDFVAIGNWLFQDENDSPGGLLMPFVSLATGQVSHCTADFLWRYPSNTLWWTVTFCNGKIHHAIHGKIHYISMAIYTIAMLVHQRVKNTAPGKILPHQWHILPRHGSGAGTCWELLGSTCINGGDGVAGSLGHC